MATRRTPQDHTIHIEAPETPDFMPQISDLRERLARLEERTEHPAADPAAAESLSLASEAHRTAAEVRERIAALENRVADLPANLSAASSQLAGEIAEVPPPPPIPDPPAEEQLPEEHHTPHHPWWHPARYL